MDAQRAGWPLQIAAHLAADDVADLAVDLCHALVGGDAQVAATVTGLAGWRGVTVRPPAGSVRQPQSSKPGGTVCGYHGCVRLSRHP